MNHFSEMTPFLILLLAAFASGKVYERCELARELKDVYKASEKHLPTWVCIAYHESRYNTSAVGPTNSNGSNDYGIFQINNKYWCSPPGTGCNVKCTELLDDNITKDFTCAKIVYEETKKESGNGFTAWSVYKPYCKGSEADKFIEGCF